MQEILKNSSTQHKQDWEICSALYGRVVDFANRLEGREAPRWHHEKIEGLRGKCFRILFELRGRTKSEMYYSSPWPTQEMNGDEVLPPEPQIPNLPGSP